MYSLPQSCTVEHAAQIAEGLKALATPGAHIELDASEVDRADISIFQLLMSLERELTASSGSLTISPEDNALVPEALGIGLGQWFANLTAN